MVSVTALTWVEDETCKWFVESLIFMVYRNLAKSEFLIPVRQILNPFLVC